MATHLTGWHPLPETRTTQTQDPTPATARDPFRQSRDRCSASAVP